LLRPPPPPTLFPYTTLFRSVPLDLHHHPVPLYVQRPPAILPVLLVHSHFIDPVLVADAPHNDRVAGLEAPRGCHADAPRADRDRSEEHTSELQSRFDLVCRL